MSEVFLRFLMAMALLVSAGPAQTSREVSSLRANVQVERNVTCHHVILTVKPLDQGADKRLVYVLQVKAGEVLPQPATADARIFLSNGLIAIRAGEEAGTAFSFPEYDIPPSLTQFEWRRTNVFGIAEYGAGIPVTDDKIQELKSAAACVTSRSGQTP